MLTCGCIIDLFAWLCLFAACCKEVFWLFCRGELACGIRWASKLAVILLFPTMPLSSRVISFLFIESNVASPKV